MFPPLFAILNASALAHTVFGTNPLRIYPIGEAPAKGAVGYALPYAVFQTVAGDPEQPLAGRPIEDYFRVQIDVIASTLTVARNGAKTIRDAIELDATVSSYNGERRDPDTGLAVYSFDVAFITPRT